MKFYKLSILLFLVLAACQTENTQIEYNDAEAVYLKLEKTFVLNADGTTELTVEKEQKLLTHRAFHSLYGQTDIYFNPLTDSVVIEIAETKTPDGEIVPVPENGYVDMIPSYATGAAQFSHLRHKAVVHTALQIGAIIHSKYTIYSSPESPNALMGHEVLAQDCPVENYKLLVKVPKDQELDFSAINISENPKLSKKGGYNIYTWQISNIDQTSAEGFAPRFNAGKKQIVFSSADSMFSVFNEFTHQEAFNFETSIEMKNTLLDRLSDKFSPFEKIDALQDIVINEIKTLPVPLGIAGYKIKPAISTWESMSGTTEEKAILLTAMIRSLGLDAIPVAVVPAYLIKKDSVINNIGNLDLLSFHLVQVSIDGDYHYIDASNKHLIDPIANLQNHFIIPMEMGYSNVQYNPTRELESQLSWDGDIVLNSKGLFTGKFEGNYIGQLNPYLGIKMNPKSIRSLYSGQSSVEDSSPQSTLLTFMVEKKNTAIKFDNKILLDLPLNKSGFDSWGIKHLDDTRNTAMYLPSQIKESQSLSIALPNGYQAVSFLTDVSKKNELGTVSIKYSQKDGSYEVLRDLNITTTRIAPEQYNLLKELVNPWLDPSMKRMLVEPVSR